MRKVNIHAYNRFTYVTDYYYAIVQINMILPVINGTDLYK